MQRRRLGSWLVAHGVEVAFAAIIVVTFVYLLRLGAKMYFQGDDWPLLHQAGTFRGILDPYNNHPSMVILALYRVLFEVFGFAYWPFRVVGLLCLLATPVAFFASTRQLLTPPLAAVAALSLLSFGTLDLSPSWLNHYLVLIGGIACAAALHRGRRADWVLAGALLFSLSAAGGGVAVAAACLVHNVCTRASLRRWLVVLGPFALWGIWQLLNNHGQRRRVPVSESLRYAEDIVRAPFEHLGFGNPVLTALVLAAFVGYGLWTIRQGLAASANLLSWSTALGVWAAGLAYSRGSYFLGQPEVRFDLSFRYELLALGFALLAVVPRRPIVWPARFPIATNRPWVIGSAVVILATTVAGAMGTRDEVESRAELTAATTEATKAALVVVSLGPAFVPDGVRSNYYAFGWVTGGELRALLRRGGSPFQSTPATADQHLVDVGGVRALPVGRLNQTCSPLTEPISRRPNKLDLPLYLWSDRATWPIYVRRFGPDWIKVAELEANQVVQVNLPALSLDQPWQVRADGACINGPPQPGE
ncbi:MAG: hypothetical protein ABIP36_06150 [Acidimicrobiales bacterium]